MHENYKVAQWRCNWQNERNRSTRMIWILAASSSIHFDRRTEVDVQTEIANGIIKRDFYIRCLEFTSALIGRCDENHAECCPLDFQIGRCAASQITPWLNLDFFMNTSFIRVLNLTWVLLFLNDANKSVSWHLCWPQRRTRIHTIDVIPFNGQCLMRTRTHIHTAPFIVN